MNRPDGRGGWIPSEPLLEVGTDGNVVGTGANYGVTISAELATVGAVTITSSRRERLRMHLLGVNWFDPDTGRSQLLGTVTNSTAEITGTNRVVFRNALTGIKASVIYEFGPRFSQWVVLEEQLPEPPPGFSPRTRLEAITEIDESPAITKANVVVRREQNAALRAIRAEPDLNTEEITFGAQTRMAAGRAFLTGASSQTAQKRIPVYRRIQDIGRRRVLIEAIELDSVRADLQRLPRGTARTEGAGNRSTPGRELPEPLVASAGNGQRPAARTARLAAPPEGYAMDYEILDSYLTGSLSGYTFQSGVTYLVNGYVYADSPYITGGVIKYTRDAEMEISNLSEVNGGGAVFTAVDDDSVGESISTGTLSGTYANIALLIHNVGTYQPFAGLDIRRAYTGLYFDNGDDSTQVIGCSFSDCDIGVLTYCPTYFYDTTFCNVNDNCVTYGNGVGIPVSVTVCNPTNPDSDSDNLPDAWELDHFGDLSQDADSAHGDGLHGDYDNDGISNYEEYLGGTDPNTIVFETHYENLYVSSRTVAGSCDVP